MSSDGFFVMHRGWRDNPIFKGEFSRGDAWIWLIENACWKPTKARIKGDNVELQRGELTFSVRFLAEKWGWSKSRVDRFLDDLRSESMIETRSKIGTGDAQKAGHGQSIITISNYCKYQGDGNSSRDNSGTTSGTTAGQQRDKEEQGNKGTIEEDTYVSPSSAGERDELDLGNQDPPAKPKRTRKPKAPPEPLTIDLPGWIPPDAWTGFVDMRVDMGKPMTDRAATSLIKKLDDFRSRGHDPTAVLDQSTINRWQDLYELKDHRNGNRGTTDRGNASGFAGRGQYAGGQLSPALRRAAEIRSREAAAAADRPDDRSAGNGGELPFASTSLLPGG